jgi:hypothetical protein
MKLKELVQGIGQKLEALFPGKLMFVDKIPSEADGNFFLEIIAQRGADGICAQRSRGVSFDLMYFSGLDDRFSFPEWADILQDGMKLVQAGVFLVRTSERTASCEEMVYHFLFSVDVNYIEYETGETMLNLEVNADEGN